MPSTVNSNSQVSIVMKKNTSILLISLITFVFSGLSAMAKSDKAATVVDNAIWADGLVYDTVLTTNSFKAPPSHTVDILYVFDMSGLGGQRPVSEAAPGDKDYNGGRWWVQFVVFTPSGMDAHDPDGDGVVNFELTSAEAVLGHVLLGHVTILESSVYFSCPLRGKGE